MTDKIKVCILCSNQHIQQTAKEANQTPSISPRESTTYLICNKCGTCACLECTTLIYEAIPKKLQQSDMWCQFLSKYIPDLVSKNITIPIGHCCEIKVGNNESKPLLAWSPKAITPQSKSRSKSKRKKRRSQLRVKQNQSKHHKKGDQEPTNEFLVEVSDDDINDLCWKEEHDKTLKTPYLPKIRYSGYIHFFGTNLLVDSPMDGDIDIHAVGAIGDKKLPNYTTGILHCVLSTKTCISLHKNNIEAKSFEEMKLLKSTKDQTLSFDIQVPYDDHKKTFRVNLISIPVVVPSNQTVTGLKGLNNLSDEMVKNCYRFESGSQSTDVDCTIILGEMPTSMNQADVLLLFRFHNLKDYTDEFASNFFRNVIGKTGKSGYEVNRTGGSGGVTTTPAQDKLLHFMHNHLTSVPRVVKAVKFIQRPTCYEIFYIGVRQNVRKVARYRYTPPKLGGSFVLTPKEFVASPFLVHFAECKVIAALIIDTLSKFEYSVAIESVEKEISNITLCSNLAKQIKDDSKRRLASLTMYNECNRHSIVAYNVGYHLDRFDKGIASLENKAVFKLPHRNWNNAMQNTYQSRGGGKNMEEFCFALLDWGRAKKSERTVALNMGIIATNQKLTQTAIDAYFVSHPNMREAFNEASQAI